MANEIPAVSVIVPMYNTEEYITELLESLLIQKLKNFEVIIVDDGSDDSSCSIVENYQRKFKSRLKLMKIPHTGCAGVARNKGLEMSRGKYIYFIDADDVLIKTALEEMYNLAERFQADVIYCEKYFMSTGVGEDFIKNIHIADSRIQSGSFVSKPELIENDMQKKVIDYLNSRFWATPWLRLSSRDFLINNNIKFQPLAHQNDQHWAFENLICAKRFVRVPNMCYVRRMRNDSLSSFEKTEKQHIKRWMERTIRGLKNLDTFMEGIDFFKNNPDYRYAILNCFAGVDLQNSLFVNFKLPPHEFYKVFESIFEKDLGEYKVLVSFLFSNSLDLYRKLIVTQQQLSKNTPPHIKNIILIGEYINVLEYQSFWNCTGRRFSSIYQSACRRFFYFRQCGK